MRRVLAAALMAIALCGGASTAGAQAPASGGYYSGGAYYVPDRPPTGGADPYWPTNNETAYYYGPYAVAPGFGPYLRLGGESGWNPNIGTTYNSYPPGDYYTDYGFPYLRVSYHDGPYVVRGYRGAPYPAVPYYGPVYPYWR
jgi:hypothetical protein